MEIKEDVRCEYLNALSLGSILDSISQITCLSPSDKSFADKLFIAIGKDVFISELESLKEKVLIHTNSSIDSDRDQHGKVFAFEVQVYSGKNDLVVTKKVIFFSYDKILVHKIEF